MSDDIITQLIDAIQGMQFHDLHIHTHTHGIGEWVIDDPIIPDPNDPVVPDPIVEPDTVIVRMTEDNKFFKSNSVNAAGYPIMDHSVIGFKALTNEYYRVVYPAVLADGGVFWYKVWLGENDSMEARDWYIPKDKTKRV